MKKILFIAFLVTMLSCKKEAPIEYAIISGKITNNNSDKLTLYNQYNFSDKKEIDILENDTFTDTVFIDKNPFYTLVNKKGKVLLFLNKGDKIAIDFNAKKIDSTLVFKGNNSNINNYLKDKNNLVKKIRVSTKELYSKNENAFLADLSTIKKKQEELLSKANLPKKFNDLEAQNIHFEYLSFLSNYKGYHSYFSKKENFTTSEGFLKALKNVDYTSENNFNFSSNYRSLLNYKYREEAEKLLKKDSTIGSDVAYLKTLASIKNQRIKNKMLFDDAQYGITYTNNLEEYYTTYSNASTNQINNKKITTLYNKLKVLSEGSPSPKFIDFENNAGGKNSLDDFKEKYVYIDVWATWCGPCIGEIPSLKKIEKQYHNKNIEFLSISIDAKKDHKKWKKMIIDKDLKGVQLFADNDWNSKFVKDYMIKGIPRFILIDPQGNIISANAPRPSDPKLVTLFNKHKI